MTSQTAPTAGPVALILTMLAVGCPAPDRRPCPDASSPPARTDTPAQLQKLVDSLKGRARAQKSKLDPQLAARLIRLSLECIDREYPNKPSDVKKDDDEAVPPRVLHPAFYGCFDWHSAVHGHWTMVRVLRTVKGLAPAVKEKIRAALDQHLDKAALSGELAYFQKDHHKLYERPYGWGWFLRLTSEIHLLLEEGDTDARRWADALQPLEQLLVQRTKHYLQRLSVPVRAGTHNSTAFALAHMHDYATVKGNTEFLTAINAASRRFFGKDQRCPTDYEPSGEDFISPCLAEADLIRRVMDPAAFSRWLQRFLPPLSSKRFEPLLRPPEVRDRRDPKIGHLIGLSLQRGWAMRGVAAALPKRDIRREIFRRLADIHREEGLRLMFDSGYGGSHWLASFAVFLLTTP